MLIRNHQIDDALAFMKDDHLKERVKEFETKFWDAVESTSKKLADIVEEQKKKGVTEKKDFHQVVTAEQPPEYHKVLFQIFDTGKNAQDIVLKTLRSNCNSKGFEFAKALLGGLKYTE